MRRANCHHSIKMIFLYKTQKKKKGCIYPESLEAELSGDHSFDNWQIQ